MSMQDNDMDQLFRSKLEHLEVEPHASVWKGIVVELNNKKKNSSLMPVIRIAASVTVFLSVGLFFLLRDYKLPKDQPKKYVVKERKFTASVDENRTKQTVSTLLKGALKQVANATVPKHRMHLTVNGNAYQPEVKTTGHAELAEVKQVNVLEHEQLLAAVNNTQVVASQHIVPDEQLSINSNLNEADGFTTPVKVAEVHLPALTHQSKKHGIRSLGDLINVVVAKVDKRENKVIEFTDTDDDDAVVTGLNLGIVRVKRVK